MTAATLFLSSWHQFARHQMAGFLCNTDRPVIPQDLTAAIFLCPIAGGKEWKMNNHVRLSGSVGPGGANNQNDVALLQAALSVGRNSRFRPYY